MVADLSEDGKRTVSAIRDDRTKMNAEFLEQLRIKTNLVDNLSEEVKVLKIKVSKLEERIEDAEAYERRDILVISGNNVPPEVPSENCVVNACSLLKNQLNLNVQPTDISTQRIILKLCKRDIKSDIFKACRQLKPKIYINESLTPVRSTIMYILRRAKKNPHSKVVGCSSSGGRVFAYVKASDAAQQNARDKRVVVNTYSELQTFCEDVLKKPLANHVDRWPH